MCDGPLYYVVSIVNFVEMEVFRSVLESEVSLVSSLHLSHLY